MYIAHKNVFMVNNRTLFKKQMDLESRSGLQAGIFDLY